MAKAGATATPTWRAQANILPPWYGEGLQKPKCSQGLQASLRVEALTQEKGKVTLVLHSSVELLSRVQLFSTLWIIVRQAALSITKSRSLLKLMSIKSVHPVFSSSNVSFSSCLQSFPASGSFQMSQFFTPGGQRTGASASASVLPVNIQNWFPLGLTGLISLQSKRLSRIFSNTTVHKSINSLARSFLYSPTLRSIHDYRKRHSFD